MPKLMLHNSEALNALAKGVSRLAAAVEPTLGPKGLNAMVDRPVGTPMITRDGVTIASEIEFADRFENMGAQVVREVSMQTNEVAGDGTTTAIVLANGLVQQGVKAMQGGAKAVDLCKGIEQAVEKVVETLASRATPARDNPKLLAAVANIAATEPELGEITAEAFSHVGVNGIITADFSVTTDTTLEVLEGMSFDRGYLSHHMVTDQEKMEAVIDNPYILLTDQKILDPTALDNVRKIADDDDRPLVIVAEEIAPQVVVTLLGRNAPGKYLIVHPPEYGHWRKAQMEDLAIITGGKVIARDLGGRIENVTREELGGADSVRATASHTSVIKGHGDSAAITARRAQVQRQHDVAPPNVEQDKLAERLAKLSGGTAIIYAGGVTPVEQKRTIQLVEDALNAVRVAAGDGVVPGGGTALAQAAGELDGLISKAKGDIATGMELVQNVLTLPASRIAENAGKDSAVIVKKIRKAKAGQGYNAATDGFGDMIKLGVVDPVAVTTSALKNAASVATLILTTETLVGDLGEEQPDPTAGPARGGGAELLGRP